MSNPALCEDPAHPENEGIRLVDRRDLFEERLEYRNVVTQARSDTRTQRHVCRACKDRKIARIDGGLETVELFS